MARWLGLAALLVAGCCTQSITIAQPVRYRLPLDGSAPGARECFQDCLPHYEVSEGELWKCLSGCPGLEVTRGERCAIDDHPPRAACGVGAHVERREVLDERAGLVGAAFGLVGGVLGGVALGAALVAGGSDREDRSRAAQ
jgi:hypothetical protein